MNNFLLSHLCVDSNGGLCQRVCSLGAQLGPSVNLVHLLTGIPHFSFLPLYVQQGDGSLLDHEPHQHEPHQSSVTHVKPGLVCSAYATNHSCAYIEKEVPLLSLCYYPHFAGKGWLPREVKPFVQGPRSMKPHILGLNLGTPAPAPMPLNHPGAPPWSELVRF